MFHFLIVLCRQEIAEFESYDQPFEISDVKLNYSSLYNAMIHPFTRMVIYGVIWYQGEKQIFF